jgi:hypothetical protein
LHYTVKFRDKVASYSPIKAIIESKNINKRMRKDGKGWGWEGWEGWKDGRMEGL